MNAMPTPVTRYEAYAEIVLLDDDQAKSEPRAVNAQEVLDHIGPMAKPKPLASGPPAAPCARLAVARDADDFEVLVVAHVRHIEGGERIVADDFDGGAARARATGRAWRTAPASGISVL